MSEEYIKKEDAIGIVKNLKRFSCFGDDGFVEIPMVYCELMQVASADVAPVRHGHWIYDYCDIVCSECGTRYDDELCYMLRSDCSYHEPRYCLWCGSTMDEEADA